MKGIRLKITPVAKPRMIRSDKWKKRPCVTKYWAYKDELNLLWKKFNLPPIGNIINRLEFHLAMPKSWSEKKKKEMNGQFHTQTPDLDNLEKGFLDALCKNDSHVALKLNSGKYWNYENFIVYE